MEKVKIVPEVDIGRNMDIFEDSWYSYCAGNIGWMYKRMRIMMVNILQNSRIIGNSIQRLLNDKGSSAAYLAEETQMSELHIQEIITASCDATAEELNRIAEVLKVPVGTLSDGSLAGEADNVHLHCMGGVRDPENMTKLLDSIDIYVRLLNAESE